jgi:hypothetical protein
VVSAVGGVQWYRADRDFAAFTRGGSAGAGERAADLWRWEPFYALEAGAHVWREGLAAGDQATISRGRRLVGRGLALDKTGPLGPADLARLELSQGDTASAVARLRPGLRWNPSQPVLQGLWGYTALAAQTSLKEPATARRVLAGLRELPVDTPDGWYWISRTLAASGDTSGAAVARTRARELAPHLGSWRYRQRLLQSPARQPIGARPPLPPGPTEDRVLCTSYGQGVLREDGARGGSSWGRNLRCGET